MNIRIFTDGRPAEIAIGPGPKAIDATALVHLLEQHGVTVVKIIRKQTAEETRRLAVCN